MIPYDSLLTVCVPLPTAAGPADPPPPDQQQRERVPSNSESGGKPTDQVLSVQQPTPPIKTEQQQQEQQQQQQQQEGKGEEEEGVGGVEGGKTPTKLLDNLFQRTKAVPSVYWLPLTDEQVSEWKEYSHVLVVLSHAKFSML